jgi:hypothetical protein
MRLDQPQAVIYRASSMISKMRARVAEKRSETGRLIRNGRRLPFGVPMLRIWLMDTSVDRSGHVWLCTYCGRQLTINTIEADHIEPLSRGGGLGIANLAIACKLCNRTKGGMSLEAFKAIISGLESFPAADRTYILRCLRTQGMGQRLRFPPKQKQAAPPARVEKEAVIG